MTAKIIVVTNQKGGCGKTTIAMNLVPTLINKGSKVLVIDGDPQGTASRWAASANEDKPYPAPVIGLSNSDKKAHQEIKKFIKDYDYIVVDCPPAVDSPFTASALLVADLAIVPIKPTPADLWAAVGIKKLLDTATDFNENLKSRIVISMSQRNNMNNDVVKAIDNLEIEKLKSTISQRTSYTQATLLGGSVHDLSDAKAIIEIDDLSDEILNIL